MGSIFKDRNRWRIQWFDADGRRRGQTYKNRSTAKKALAKLEVEAQEIRSGLKPRPGPQHSFSELCDYWLEHRTTRKKSPKDDQSIIDSSLRPFFGTMQLASISLEQVDRFRRQRCPGERETPDQEKDPRRGGHLSVKTLHNHLTLLISMLNLAVDLGWLQARPRIKKPKLSSAEFSYLRTEGDIRSFLVAAREEELGVFELYTTAILTGMRAGELCGLTWGDIDLKRRLITVQRSFEKTTKTDEVRHIPILDPLLPVLMQWKLECPTATIVFPNKRGKMHQPSARVVQEILHRVRERAGITYRFRFHDLRHTFASHWMMSGGDIYRLQRILGHKSIQMTERYSHLSPDAFSSDYGKLRNLVPTPESVQGSNVVPMPD